MKPTSSPRPIPSPKFEPRFAATVPGRPGIVFLATLALLVGWAATAADLFVEVRPAAWTNAISSSATAAWGDYDGEGRLDVYLPKASGEADLKTLLYHQEDDGTFALTTAAEVGPIASDYDNLGAYWADANNDGRLDLLVVNWIAGAGSPPSQPAVPELGGRTFSSVNAGAWRSRTTPGVGNWCDYDRDGWLDAFICAASNDSGHRTNLLFHGRGDGTFDLVTDGPIATNRITSGFSDDSLWTDLDGDGDQDLLVSNLEYTRDFAYRNDGQSRFTRLTNSILEQAGQNSGARPPATWTTTAMST
jgi:hypothetical protein